MSSISRKVTVLQLRNLHSAYVNMRIPVILRQNSSVYDLQKLRYRCAGRTLKGRGKISVFARVTVNDSTLVLFLMVKLARNRREKSCRSYFILNLWAAIIKLTECSREIRHNIFYPRKGLCLPHSV